MSRVVINDFSDTVYYARLIIEAENELEERKIIEIDARPSDSIALAVQAGAPSLVVSQVWEAVEDMSIVLNKMEENNEEGGFPDT